MAPRISVRPAGHQVGGAAELDAAVPRCLRDQALALVLRHVDEPARRRVGDRGHDDQVAQAAQQVLGEAARVLAGLDHLVDHAEDGRAVAGRERLDDLVEQRVGRVAEQAGRQRVGDPVGAGPAHQLVEDREGVARRAPLRRGPPAAARPARSGRPRARRARRGRTTAAAAGSAGTGSGGCAT